MQSIFSSFARLLEEEEESKWTGEGFGGVPYDPQEGLVAVFSRWRGTVLPLVLKKNMFWLLMMIHVGLLFINEYFIELTPMDVSIVIGLPASLLIFLTVFYNGNCYTRFFELWAHTCELTSIVNNWVLQTAFIFEELDAEDGAADGVISQKGPQVASGMMSKRSSNAEVRMDRKIAALSNENGDVDVADAMCARHTPAGARDAACPGPCLCCRGR